jgi:iron complex transport system substrate-binding protein
MNQNRRKVVLGGAMLLAGALHTRAQAQASRRVIVVGGALAEIVYALGAQSGANGTLVATDTTCTYPDAARALPKVGYQRALSAEGLLSLRPDLILASAEAGPPGVLSQVQKAGVEVVSFPEHHNVESVRGKITGMASALGTATAGTALQTQFDREWQRTLETVNASPLKRGAQSPRVVFVMSNAGNQAMVAGQNTAADAMLTYAGARNAMQGFKGYRPMSAEALVSAAPDIVLITDDALGGAGALLASPGFTDTPAGRAKRVVSLDALFLLGFGPRLPAAVATLNRHLAQA